MTEYVCGFLFAFRGTQRMVALLRKARPEWQAGRLNGVGGRMILGELPVEAMVREFQEEVAYATAAADWSLKVRHAGPGHVCYFFRADLPDGLVQLTGQPDEPVAWFPVDDLIRLNVIPNLRWLIPLCLDDDIRSPVEVYDHSDPNNDGATVREKRAAATHEVFSLLECVFSYCPHPEVCRAGGCQSKIRLSEKRCGSGHF